MVEELDRVVKDKRGDRYRLVADDNGDLLVVHLMRHENEVGRVQCVVYPDEMEMLIGDIIIDDQVVHLSQNPWVRLWQAIVKPKPINYRNRGLGAHLLEFTIDYARNRGIKRLYGSLTPEDIASIPGLANWYRKYGFHVGKPGSGDKPNWSRISLELR